MSRVIAVVMVLGLCVGSTWAATFVQDDYTTLGLWRCDSSFVDGSKTYTPDENTTRGNDLELRNGAVISTGGGWDGNAVELDGTDDFLVTAYTYQENIVIEMAFKLDNPTSGANRYLVELASMVRLYVNVNNQMALTVWDSDSVAKTINADIQLTTDWQRVYAQYDADGLMQLFVYDAAGNTVGAKQGVYNNGSINVKTASLVIGSYRGGSHFFDGMLDEIRVANPSTLPPAYMSPHADQFGSVWGLWHMDSEDLTGTDKKSPDDDSAMPLIPRNNDIPYCEAGVYVPVGYPDPCGAQLVDPVTEGIGYPGGVSSFDKCLKFDGVNDHLMAGMCGADPTNMRVEAWVKSDASVDPTNVGQDFVFDDWGQTYVRLSDSGAGEMALIIYYWPDTGGAVGKVIEYSDISVDYHDWHHIAVQCYNAVFSVEVNGVEVGAWALPAGAAGLAAPTKPFRVAARYNDTSYFHGYIDEVRVGEAVPVVHELPDWLTPYTDNITTNALWHLDSTVDPNDEPGTVYKDTNDDDSENPGRDKDLTAYSGTDPVPYGSADGPTVVDPCAAGVGYPINDPCFANCFYFEDPVMGERDQLRRRSDQIVFDPNNVRFEGWIRLDDTAVSTQSPTATTLYYWFSRRGQVRLAMQHSSTLGWVCYYAVWGSDGVADHYGARYDDMGIAPNEWHHVALEVNGTSVKFYVNGILRNTGALTAPGLGASQSGTFVGSKWSSSDYFWGYIDEVRVSQAVPNPKCGDWGYLDADINEDCVVNETDLSQLASAWLASSLGEGQLGVLDQYQTFNLPQAATTPSIDGVLSAGEWADAKITEIVYPDIVTPPQAGSERHTAPDGSDLDPADISARFYYKWDSTYLYLAADVTDDIHIVSPAGGDGYPNDHILLGFNPNGNLTAAWEETLSFEFWRNPTGAADTTIRQDDGGALVLTNSVLSGSLPGSGWQFELALKWDEIVGGGYSPALSDQHGIAFLICDNDANDDTRDVLMADVGDMAQPSLYHTVTLTDGLACGDNGYIVEDINGDCAVSLGDLAVMTNTWLQCTDPDVAGCINVR